MESLIFIAIGLMIIYQSYKLIEQQQRLKKDLKKMKDDYNLEFKGPGGSVSRQRKYYPDQEHQANDDFRYSSSEPTEKELKDNIDRRKRHSLSGHMNDPSEVQKKAFKRENQV